jgi:hypothetical protein
MQPTPVPFGEPEPFVAADYGAPALEPEVFIDPEPEMGVAGMAAVDAGAGNAGFGGAGGNADVDAGAAQGGLGPMLEPEPLGVAEYGVPPLDL